ncbi:hypothetical protein CDB79_RS02695 [Vibrio parahaemolyticus]|uniref:hypothetical protein n=1 Tax=Vibrio parahaemolyticus TaxID=670 RepID=UPI0004247EC3|nr:hypothetical protein [Vibrio parahaemolyticus]EJG1709467.1 hypothetical protein [Vibrio parahaemolyticus]EJG1740864.1 hypothetical protein [Vibrio parahaemolyticus]EJG1778183.1 hypothetical protein [Vibrio parahaemolyticus]MDF4515044.1 hypothetical protein [Vibrio parahaemolyticus]MDF4520124.1 hypothetical protein [Vibrio parahaemolyticus]
MKSNKISLKPIISGNLFFPQPDEVLNAIGISPTPRNKIKMIQQWFNIQTKLSDSSLDNLGKGGIKERTLNRALKPIHKKIFGMIGSIKSAYPNLPKTKVHVWDSGHFWMSTIAGFKLGYGRSNSSLRDITPIETFLTERNQQNQKLVEFGTKHPPNKKTLKAYYKMVLPMTRLDPSLHSEIFTFIDNYDKSNQISMRQATCVMLAQWDFHLSLLAAIDHCLITDWKLHKSHPQGLFGNLFDLEGKTFLGKFIHGLKVGATKTFCELARYIPLNKKETNTGRSLLDAQIETLKAWRSGKQLPSYQTLCKFIERIYPDTDMSNYQIIGCVCLSIDRLVENLSKNDSDKLLMRSIFSSSYYKAHFEELSGRLN